MRKFVLMSVFMILAFFSVKADLWISDVAGLKAFRDAVNSGNTYSGQTIYLTADINLNGESWTPIGHTTDDDSGGFQGTFDGQGHKISNLNVYVYRSVTSDYALAGLFGINNGIIKNLFMSNPISEAETKKDLLNSCAAGTIAALNGGQIYNCIVVGGSVTTKCGYGTWFGYAITGGVANNKREVL